MSRFMPIAQAAERLGKAPNTIVNWYHQNRVPGMFKETGLRGKYYVPTKWVEENTPDALHKKALESHESQG